MYKYTSRDLLENKENYMYSSYLGSKFIIDFKESRKNFKIKLNNLAFNSNNKISYIDSAFLYIKVNFQDYNSFDFIKLNGNSNLNEIILKNNHFSINNFKEEINTFLFLSSIISDLISSKLISEDCKYAIHKLIQRFEVSKKIFCGYKKFITGGIGSFKEKELYLMLICILNLYYLQTKSLSCLNCILKLMDLLISLPIENYQESNSAFYLKIFIDLEEIFISELINKLNIKL